MSFTKAEVDISSMEICRAVVLVGAKVGKENEYVPGSVIVSVEKAVVVICVFCVYAKVDLF